MHLHEVVSKTGEGHTGETVTTAGVIVLVEVVVSVVVKRLVTVVELRVMTVVLAERVVTGGSVSFCVTV